jgi:hypothetical protein
MKVGNLLAPKARSAVAGLGLAAMATLFGPTGVSFTDITRYGPASAVGVAPVSCLQTPRAVQEWSPPNAYLKQYLIGHGLSIGEADRFVEERILKPEVPQPAHPACYRNPTPRTSGNWSGYISDFKNASNLVWGVLSNYHVRAVCSNCAQVATFAGVGGVNGQNLAQTGADQWLLEAWIELYPNPPVYEFFVNNGDYMYSNVSYDNVTAKWSLSIQDVTRGASFSSEYSFNPDQTSGEWIVETLSSSVPSFSNVDFTYSDWYDNNGFLNNINSDKTSTVWQVTDSPGCGTIVPGALGADGSSFVDVSHHC